jgi:uncharacterized protein YjiK
MNRILLILLWITPIFLWGQNPANKEYYFNLPDKVFNVPFELEEISGLGLSDSFLLAVQDEDGLLFALDKNTGDVIRKSTFMNTGDYEGVEWVNGKAYIIQSKGRLFEVSNPGISTQKTKEFKLKFLMNRDLEGLGYDSKGNQLLLACKGPEKATENFKRDIFGFRLKNKKLVRSPLMTITREDLYNYCDVRRDDTELRQLAFLFRKENPEFQFGPSGIAVHPMTGKWWVLSSKGSLLLVIDPSTRKIETIYPLLRIIHKQPEGIAFDKDGTLYISNEGKKDNYGKIMVYKPKQKN